MTGEFANLYINVQALGKEVNIQLIVAMKFEKVNFIVGHLHFTVVIFKTGFINDNLLCEKTVHKMSLRIKEELTYSR